MSAQYYFSPKIAKLLLEKLHPTLLEQYKKIMNTRFNLECEEFNNFDSEPAQTLQIFAFYIEDIIESCIQFKEDNESEFTKFFQDILKDFIIASLKRERTLPSKKRDKEDTPKFEDLILSGVQASNNSSNNQTWQVDGLSNNEEQFISQLTQHLNAFLFICSKTNLDTESFLSVQLLHETHSRLLKNSVDNFGKRIRSGQFRSSTVN